MDVLLSKMPLDNGRGGALEKRRYATFGVMTGLRSATGTPHANERCPMTKPSTRLG